MAVRSALVLIIAHLSSHLSSALSSTPSLLSGGFAARGAYLAARAREDAARAAKRAVFGDALAQLPVAGKRGLAAGSKSPRGRRVAATPRLRRGIFVRDETRALAARHPRRRRNPSTEGICRGRAVAATRRNIRVAAAPSPRRQVPSP